MTPGEMNSIICIFGACGVVLHFAHAAYTVFEAREMWISKIVTTILISLLGFVLCSLYFGWLFATY